MTPTRRMFAATVATVIGLVATGVAYAAGVTVTTDKLGGVALAVPVFFPDSLGTANGGANAGRPEANDTITITYNGLVQVSSVCAGAAQSNTTLSGFTFTITNGAAGANDVLSVTGGPAACAAPKIGTFDLGSPSFVTANTAYSNSTFALTLNASTTTVLLTLGKPAANATTVPGAVNARYTPDPAIKDTAAHVISSVAATPSTTQF